MGEPTKTARWGVVVEASALRAWQARAVEHLLAVAGASLALVVRAPRRARAAPARSISARLRDRYARGAAARSAALRPADLPAAAAPAIDLSGGAFTDAEIGRLRESDLDFILWFAEEAPRGPILDVPRAGVWCLQHGEAAPGAGAPCLAEMVRGDPVIAVTLRRARAGGEVVLRRGFFAVAPHSYAATLDRAHLGGAHLPADACRALLAGADLTAADLAAAPAPRAPEALDIVPHLARVGLSFGRAHWGALMLSEQWCVGIVDRPISAFLEPGFVPEVRWLPTVGRHRFLADPFGLPPRAGEPLTILLEDWDYRVPESHIAFVTERADGSFTDPLPIMSDPPDMSYPYLFSHEGEIYCVPAGELVREVRLHRARRFPDAWEQAAVLVEGFSAADPTLFRHEGRFWLFFTDHETGTWTRLFAYHAPALLGPWEPHAANPIKVDVRSSRCAGSPFVADGQLYRPSQDCSRAYGGAVTIKRVLRLTPTEFAEETARVVEPDPRSPFPAGLHTLSAMGDRTLVDAKRMLFVGSAFRRGLTERIQRRLSR